MATNQGLLQAQIKVKNTIDLNNAFSSPSVTNLQLKSIEGDLNLSNEYALQSFNSSNTNTQHIDTIRTNSSNTLLKEALNNLPNLKYVRLEGSYESKGNSFDNNTNLQKVDLSESLQVKPEDFKANENLKTLPNLDYSNPDLTDIITNDTNLLPITFDISNEPNTNKLGIHGDSTHQLGNLEFVKVNTEAPFDNQITPQIDVSYTSLDRNGLVNLFNTMPYNVGYTIVGNPTIVDGIASGFSTDDYLQYWNDTFPQTGMHTYEITTKFTTGEDVSGTQKIMGSYTYGGNAWGLAIISGYGLGSVLRYMKPNDTTVYTLDVRLPNPPAPNTTYYGRLFINIDTGAVTVGISTDGVTYEEITATAEDYDTPQTRSWILMIGGAGISANVFKGSVDLNETRIKINSQVSTGPVGYTLSGNATVTNGILSNIVTSPSSSCVTPSLPEEYSTLEFMLNVGYSVQFGTSDYIPVAGFNSVSSLLRINANSRTGHRLYYTSSDSDYIIEISNAEFNIISAANQAGGYYIKLLVQKNNDAYTYTLGCSTDKQNWITKTATSSVQLCKGLVSLLRSASGASAGKPQMNLNNTYIKVNGKLWFGHESKQVTWFNGKPSQIKVVDISGATGASSLTNDDKAIVTNKGWTLVTNGSNSKNYTIEDGKLTWANPNIYLEGATKTLAQNTIPEIVDGVFTRTSNSPILEIATTQAEWGQFNTYDFEFGTKIDISNVSNMANNLNFIGSRYTLKIACNESKNIYGAFDNTTSTGFAYYGGDSPISDGIYQNLISGPVFFRFAKNGTTISYSLSKDKQTWMTTNWYDIVGSGPVVSAPLYILQSQSLITDSWVGAVIDLKETYIKVNGQLWFYGKNYATQNIAPVPANYTYGSTTTPSIGYVDMRTQEFMAAPEGATYNWDLE